MEIEQDFPVPPHHDLDRLAARLGRIEEPDAEVLIPRCGTRERILREETGADPDIPSNITHREIKGGDVVAIDREIPRVTADSQVDLVAPVCSSLDLRSLTRDSKRLVALG